MVLSLVRTLIRMTHDWKLLLVIAKHHHTQYHTRVTDELSVTYGSETHESGTAGDQDAEITGISFAYTAGGMTLSGSMKDGENLSYTTDC